MLTAIASFALCRESRGQAAPASAVAVHEESPAATCAATPWLCWSASTGADVRPVTGMDAVASGIVLTALGTLSFATAPICLTGVVKAPEQGSCFTVSFAAGTPLLLLGVPLIAFGAVQHAKYEEWARRHPGLTGWSISPMSGGGGVGWSRRF